MDFSRCIGFISKQNNESCPLRVEVVVCNEQRRRKEVREKEIDKNSCIWLICILHFMLDTTVINMKNEPGN